MRTFIIVIGIMMIAAGVTFFVRPDFVKKIINFVKVGSRVYFAAIIRIAISVVFFLGAHTCGTQWAIITLGIIFLLSGILIFVANASSIRYFLDWLSGQSEVFHRLIGLLPIIFGTIILICV